jgi:beta-glucuronidase
MLYPQLNSCRNQTSLDGLWDFRFQWLKDNPSGWENGFPAEHLMAVPASFNDLLVTHSQRNHWGYVWYSRTFEVPAGWQNRRTVLRIGSANYSADVWLNGELLGSHETGYTPFEFDVSSQLKDGSNLLVVRVNTRLTKDTVPQGEVDLQAIVGWGANYPPGNFDFFTYSGIHRSVVLYTTAKDFIDRVLIDTEVAGKKADVKFRVRTQGGDQLRVTVQETAQSETAAARPGETTVSLCIDKPRLWDVGQPELYHARIELLRKGEVADVYTEHFGIRTIKVEGSRILLNGKPVYFKGFGKHEDFFLTGKANNTAVNVRDFELLKWIGANSFRTSHYPYAEEILDMADRLGFLVISESPAVTIVPDKATGHTLSTHCAVQQEYMLRDYNHPSVVMWCVANEPISHQQSARPYFEKVVAAAREIDTHRPLMLVTCFGDRDVCLDLVDVIGINCYPGWYWGGGVPFGQTMKWFEDYMVLLHGRCGGHPMILTEFGGDALPGVHNLPGELWTEEYQQELLKEIIAVVRKSGFFCGEHVWSFADFRTGQNYTRAYGNHKGVFTRDRQPKMAAHMLRELWKN